MKRKTAIFRGLQFTPVWFEDKSLTSPDYFQISEFPTRLTAGKNLFKLRGHPTNLRIGGYVNIEIIDYNGNPIYYEILNYLDEDKSRVISIHIHEDTPPGDCTIILVAEAIDVPENWKNQVNVRWSRTVPVNPNVSNISEIIFENLPDVTITEQIGPHLDRTYSGSIQFPTLNTGTVKYFTYNNQPAIELTGSSFTKDMSTGTIIVSNPINPSPTPTYALNTTAYKSTIKKILSPTLALLDTEYRVFNSGSLTTHTYNEFDSSTFNLTYEASPIYTQTENSESYALIEIKNLQPSTGDVSRIKVFMNNNGTVGTWELINDIELSETEIFVSNTASLYPDQSIGLFYSQSVIDTYWQSHTYIGRTETTAPTLIWNTASLNDAMQIQNSIDISQKNAVCVAQINSTNAGIFIENSEYKVTLDALGTRNNSNNPILSLYISGSSFSYDSTDYFNQELPVILGKRLGQIEVNKDNQRFDDISFNFTADNTGTGVLLLVVENGDWQVSDIRTTSDNDAGYTPNYTRIKTLVPTAHKSNNQITFKTEYYNVDGAKSKQINYVYNKAWEGGNRYIDGNYSMLTGSLYVADSLNTGVAISGYKNTGFIRSLGYEGFYAGFPGFLMWSGSALSGSLGTKGGSAYSGVGLELYANTDNYLRYSTADSELDIRTDNIFIGNSTTFISASNGNIKISGSNIDLNTEKFLLGNTNNFISGSNGNIRISGSNVSISTPNFFLGDASTQFISGSNGLMTISSSKFFVSSSGQMTAEEGIFKSTSQADLFVYRLLDLLSSEDYTYAGIPSSSRPYTLYTDPAFPNPTASFIAINLVGQRIGGVSGKGPSQFIRVQNSDFPIGSIVIHPDSYYDDFTYRSYGATIILEGGTDFYMTKSTYSANGIYADSYIASDENDMFDRSFFARDVNGVEYVDTIMIPSGSQVLLAQSKFAWRIVAISKTANLYTRFEDILADSVTVTNFLEADSLNVNAIYGANILASSSLFVDQISSWDGTQVRITDKLRLTNVQTGTSGLSTGDVYKDASGFLKIMP